MTKEVISLGQAMDSLRGRPGLVFGSNVTTPPKSFSLIVETAVNEISGLNDITSENLSIQLDVLRDENPTKACELEKSVIAGLENAEGIAEIQFLVLAGWSMCISLTRDFLFESAMQNYQDSLPTSKSITIIDHPSVRTLSRTIPIYKLFGNLCNKEVGHTLVLSESDILVRKKIWQIMLVSCADFLHGDPLIFAGTEGEIEFVQELLSIFLVIPPPAPNSILFLKDDPVLENKTIRRLCNSLSKVKIVDSTIREFSHAIKELTPKQVQLNLSLPDKETSEYLSSFNSIVSLVPSQVITDQQFQIHRQALVDSLFKPTVVDWDPYLCELDIRRDCVDELLKSIDEICDHVSQGRPQNLILRGNAGIGKTTILKRTAVELSKLGYVSLWCRRAPLDNWMRAYRDLASEIMKIASDDEESEHKFVIFIDDPWSLRINPVDLIACFSQCVVPIAFVFSLRNTEYFNPHDFPFILPSRSQYEIEVPIQLSKLELDNLSEMLVRIGAVSTQEESECLIKNIPIKNADDVLCSLWYLVPETRTQLADSLKDEYYRLGNITSSITDIANSTADLGEAAQHAYEFVAVTSKFHIGLPMEVLVRALGIGYEGFIDMTIDGKPLWGLIYDEEDNDNQTVLYRTRNDIVTRVLVELVNGGVGHAGEFRVLLALLFACDVGSQIYREFIIELLVHTNKELEKYFTYQQGLKLFDVAQKALPYEDRLLAHHKGIWIHRVGRDYQKAYKELEKALDSQEYPGAARETHKEHIHTSLAAAVVGLVREGTQSPSSGLQLVKEHIQQAKNPRLFSAHTGHISANLLFEMAMQQDTYADDGVGISSFSEALHEVEKSMQDIGPGWKFNPRAEKSVELLRDLQRKIVDSIPNNDELKDYAYRSFDENQSQIGFELLLRKALSVAQISDKGTSYNKVKNSIDEYIAYIKEKDVMPSVEIYAIRIDLIVRWRLQRARGPIDWEGFKEDLDVVLADSKYRDNPIKNYYLAVAFYHLAEIEQANVIFSFLRRLHAIGLMPKDVRCYYLGPEGFPKRFQCEIDRSHGRSYAQISDLNADIIVAGSSSRKIVSHAYIGFSLNGPLAFYDKPNDNYMLLA